ncbi:M20/M25/M40 family metallo-hydrolase [Spirosoma aerophilum]
MNSNQGRQTVGAILEALTAFPHRGAATENERKAADWLQNYLSELGASVRKEPFQTPKTYATIVYWIIGGLLTGLALLPVTGVAIGLVFYFIWLGWLYFNWRYSFITRFPAQHTAYNVLGHWSALGTEKATRKVILMAHYDTAPISWLYGPKQQANFRLSLIISLWLMLLSGATALLEVAGTGLPYVSYLRYGLMAYFVVQAVIGTAGYWLNGYTNGASDNATGVAAAILTASQLHQQNLPDVDIDIVLTSAEEVGMIGAYHYVEARRKKWNPSQMLVINFDTLGAGTLTIVEETGTAEIIHYDNIATRLARQLLETENFRNRAQVGQWHTADFDSVWFVRNKIPVLALCSLDENGTMPRIHRADDTLTHVDRNPIYTAIELAEAVVWKWMSDEGREG